MAAMAAIGGIISLFGTIVSAAAASRQAEAERNAAEYNAQMQERRAMEERAVAQRKSFEKRDKKDLALSQLQARAAASGGGAGVNDASVVSLATNIEGQGEYQALGDMFVGESRGRALENQANLDRYIGETKADALEAKALGTVIGGVGGLFGKFG